MNETLQILLFLAGFGFAAIFFISLPLSLFVALKSRPARRAIWTVLPGYVITAVGFSFMGDTFSGLQFYAPLLVLPGALLVFAYWRWTFGRSWVEESEINESTRLANADWRIGLIVLAVIVVVFIGRYLLRLFVQGLL